MIKKINIIVIIAVVVLLSFLSPHTESKIGHVDTEYILKKIPAYQDAQAELDRLANQFKQDIKNRMKEVDSLYKIYQKESPLWDENIKRKKENEIVEKEKQIRELQKKYFAPDGQLAQKREELLKPIQDNLYDAIKKIAEDGNYDYIFDKNTGEILYARQTNDLSDFVLKKLGYE